jgi:hypothetical protein
MTKTGYSFPAAVKVAMKMREIIKISQEKLHTNKSDNTETQQQETYITSITAKKFLQTLFLLFSSELIHINGLNQS